MSQQTTIHETDDREAPAKAAETIREKLRDAMIPGYQVEFDPEEAERAGAFVEDALSEQDAAESGADLADEPGGEAPALIAPTNTRERHDPKGG